MDIDDPPQALARRLRALREEQWPGTEITQGQLAKAMGVSVPAISSWESRARPRVPPLVRLDSYAAIFATRRSLAGGVLHRADPADLTPEEEEAVAILRRELLHLRGTVMAATHPSASLEAPTLVAAAQLGQAVESLATGPWRFADGSPVTIVCAQPPPDMLAKIPYTDAADPDYTELLTYSELDALFELHGHLSAANPDSEVALRTVDRLEAEHYTRHLITLGGIDWNRLTSAVIESTGIPVRQVADWEAADGQFFEVEENGTMRHHRAALDTDAGRRVLREDVALFARAVNPFNQERTLTICSGMYGRGTYGAVRALTDPKFRDRNAEYLEARFAGSGSYCLLTRVGIVNGQTLTPDWTVADYRLFEWSGDIDAA